MSVRLFLANKLTAILPPTRFYRIKTAIYRWAGLDVDRSARLCSSVTIWGGKNIKIGKETFIGHDVLIVSGPGGEIVIGDNVDIGPRVVLLGGTHHMDPSGTRIAGAGISKPIRIENGVWIGGGSIVLGGAAIGEMSMVGAGSVVSKSLPPRIVARGVPCNVVKRWDPGQNSYVDEPVDGRDATAS